MAYPISADTAAKLRTAHVARPRLEIPNVTTSVPILNGSVSLDGTSLVRTTARLTIASDWWDIASQWPAYGRRAQVYYGVGALDTTQTTTEIPFAQMIVESVTRTHPGAEVEVTLSDLMRLCQYRSFDVTYNWPGQTAYSLLLKDLMTPSQQNQNPNSVYGADPTTGGNTVFDAGSERLDAIRNVVDACNSRISMSRGPLYWEVQPKVPFNLSPVWDVNAGQTGVLLGASEEMTAETTRNRVIVFSEPNDGTAPVYAIAEDTDPSSPTRTNGPFGIRVFRRSSGFLKDITAMTALAKSLLADQLGLLRKISVDTTPAPHLDPFDVVYLTLPGQFQELRDIAKVEIDLAGGPTRLELAQHRVVTQ
jgi:hypothetical protein